ncbi:MAG: SLBB domain-containing protein [Nitrospirae bacterium]|nr:SLBB domain-containing protein [Nitrospirota bacterium]
MIKRSAGFILLLWIATFNHEAHAQDILERCQAAGFSPEQCQKAENLTPAQKEAIAAEMAKSGGKLTPEGVESLKKNPELKEIKPENTPEEKREIGKEPAPIDVQPEVQKAEEEQKKETIQPLKRFGLSFFEPARARLLSIEKGLREGRLLPKGTEKNAVSGFVGPLDMVSSYVNTTIPPNYLLNPGDKVIVYYWGDNIELTTLNLLLDEKGEAGIPKAGRIVARGMTLAQFQDAVKSQLERALHMKIILIATLDNLKSIQIYITGEVFRPGSYAVSSVTSLFNALYASGGPGDLGSLREIKLLRKGSTATVDFYDYLLNGNSKYDQPLQAGDVIFISKAEKVVAIEGEVQRPGIYELKKEEGLKDLFTLAGGIKPSGVLQRIHIKSVVPNKQRVLVDVDISKNTPGSNPELYDGDAVSVLSILPGIENKVTVEGKVERPGEYELKKNMKISDLFSEINRPLGEAYMDRADILRVNDDKRTTTLISVNLGKALSKDPEDDLPLRPLDRVMIYSKWDVRFLPPRTVAVSGAVQRPDNYERSDGMRIKDLLFKAGNVMPDAYLERADLLRFDFDTERYTHIPLNIEKVLQEGSPENILLQDRDSLRVYTLKEKTFIPEHKITVLGSVQRPGVYTRFEGMRLNDLLMMAGGPLPGVDDKIEVAKAMSEGHTRILPVHLSFLLKGDETQNILLDDEDVVTVNRNSDFYERPRWIKITGEVKNPGIYALYGKNDRLSDLIGRAGGTTEFAYRKGTIFMRKKENIPSDIQKNDTLQVNRILDALNALEYDRQVVRNRLLLEKEFGHKEALPQPFSANAPIVTSGASVAQAAAVGMAPGVAHAAGQTVAETADLFGPLPGVAGKARKLGDVELKQSERIIINLEDALHKKGGEDDPVVMEGDTLWIPQKEETVSVIGAVMRPTTVHFSSLKVKDYIKWAGDYAFDANTGKVLVMRVDGKILPADEVKAVEAGDIIYVPTKVMSVEIIETADKVIGVIKYAVTTVASVVVFIALLHLF